jgi:hypothetical protein
LCTDREAPISGSPSRHEAPRRQPGAFPYGIEIIDSLLEGSRKLSPHDGDGVGQDQSNEARMMAMASAKTNIETKLAGLAQRERQLRQEEVTTEIIELAAGAEASQSSRW